MSVFRRKVGTAALLAFRAIPTPIKRRVIRIASPTYVAGAVCLLEHDGEVLMLWQPHRTGWSLPGGFMDKGETPAEAVQRELREEIGIAIDPGDPITVRVDPVKRGIDVIFRVKLDHRPEVALSTEARRSRWVRPDDLIDADATTLAILAAVRDLDRPRRPGRLVE